MYLLFLKWFTNVIKIEGRKQNCFKVKDPWFFSIENQTYTTLPLVIT